MAKMQKHKDGSKTYYPKPGENRRGTSYDEGRTYQKGGPEGTPAMGSIAKKLKMRVLFPEETYSPSGQSILHKLKIR